MSVIDPVRALVRSAIRRVAMVLNAVSRGKVSPNAVTISGMLMHVPIAILIALGGHEWLAAGLLVIFGLFDVLDGELARLQGRSSASGMLLDASTDRVKETLLYTGAAFYFTGTDAPRGAVWAVAALGASICVSYVKAKGEAAVAAGENAIDHATLNRMFKDGLLTFEIRMVLFIVGLLTGQLAWILMIVAVLAGFTAFQRLHVIMRALSHA